MPTTFYIPPPGLSFRLLGNSSQCVFVSRNDWGFFQYTVSKQYSDQFWTLVPGTGTREGLFLVKNVSTGKVLYSRTGPNPGVGHVGGDGGSDDTWFRLEPGEGQYARMFRLLNPASSTVVVSRTQPEPQVCNFPATSTKYPEQYFSFLFEDMEVLSVDYGIQPGTIESSAPLVLASQRYSNYSSCEMSAVQSLDTTVTHTSKFEYGEGCTVNVGTKFLARIPIVCDGEVQPSDALTNNEWTFGETNEFSQTYTASVPITVARGQTRVDCTVTRGQLEVPYKMYLRSRSLKVETYSRGTWRGISSWDLYPITAVTT